MTQADDANLPVKFNGQSYVALTMADVAELVEAIPEKHTPRAALPFVTVTEAMQFGRSPMGLDTLMAIVADRSDIETAGLMIFEKLQLAGALTDRLYGNDPAASESDGQGDNEAPPPLADAPAS